MSTVSKGDAPAAISLQHPLLFRPIVRSKFSDSRRAEQKHKFVQQQRQTRRSEGGRFVGFDVSRETASEATNRRSGGGNRKTHCFYSGSAIVWLNALL